MTSTKLFRHALATASLAFGLAATPVAISAQMNLIGTAAVAKEAESGGKHSEAGDKRGGGKSQVDDHPGQHNQNGKRGQDRNGRHSGSSETGDRHGGKNTADDHPGNHSQNGKRK